MKTLELKYLTEPALRRKAVKIRRIEPRLRDMASQMLEVRHRHEGVGLAANQVGSLERIAVIQTEAMEQPLVLINPEITAKEGSRQVTEGCLSIPGQRETIERAVKVKVKAQGLDGKPLVIKAEGLLAQAIEHETDHLNGILYTDHLIKPREPGLMDYL